MDEPDADASLVEEAQQGSCSAFEQLVRPHYAAVRRIAFAFCRRRADADDLAQEALLKAYRSLHSFRGGSLSAWLYAVTRSVCHDWYRHRKVRAHLNSTELDEPQHADDSDGPAELLSAKSESEALWDAIRELDPKFRIPLVLFDIEGLSYEEIARIERTPVGTIRSRLSRARKQLLDALQPVGPGTLSAEEASTEGSRQKSRRGEVATKRVSR